MKPTPSQRRRGPRVALLALFLCSLLVPLAFIFDRAPSGYATTEERRRQEVFLPSVHPVEQIGGGGGAVHRVPVHGARQDPPKKVSNGSTGVLQHHNHTEHRSSGVSAKPKVLPVPRTEPPKAVKEPTQIEVGEERKRRDKGAKEDEMENAKACQLEFGSYCLWSTEHKVIMKDLIVKRLKDQLFVARSYYPSIAKLQGQEVLTQDMKQNIQDHERILSASAVDADLPSSINTKIEQMEHTIARAKACTVECHNVARKLRQILDMTDDEAHFHMKQSAFLYNLGAQTLPKTHHCFSMRLTLEYFKSPSLDSDVSLARKFNTPNHRHYVILSKNVLAASVVINSTVISSKEPGKNVFHILTDAQNFYGMKYWFARNSYNKAAIDVVNYEEMVLKKLPKLSTHVLYLSEEFRVLIRSTERPTEQTRMEYLSLFSHSHFFIPEIFKDLKKVVVLDDDVVIQRDLSFLWNLDMGDKVNGAVEFCGVRLGQVRNLLGKAKYDPKSCSWMSGVNVINLDKWRKHKVTENYLMLLKQVARSSASLHYNGNMKPWLELGILEYKKYWRKFLTREDRFMDECNVNP